MIGTQIARQQVFFEQEVFTADAVKTFVAIEIDVTHVDELAPQFLHDFFRRGSVVRMKSSFWIRGSARSFCIPRR